jgi:hypothetical protein
VAASEVGHLFILKNSVEQKPLSTETLVYDRRDAPLRGFSKLRWLPFGGYAHISPYTLFLTPSFPQRRESRNVAFGATRRHSLIGNHSSGENELDSRLRGNDEGVRAKRDFRARIS